MGTLYYGDNLDILRRYLKDETVDLVYLDPPFNSAQNYNAFFQEKDGTAAASQIRVSKVVICEDISDPMSLDLLPRAGLLREYGCRTPIHSTPACNDQSSGV